MISLESIRISFDSPVTSFHVSVCPAVCCLCLRYKCAREAFLDGASWNPRRWLCQKEIHAPKTLFLQDPAVVKSIIEDFQYGSLNLETIHAMFVMCVCFADSLFASSFSFMVAMAKPNM